MQRTLSWPIIFSEYLGTFALVFFGGLAVCMVQAHGSGIAIIDMLAIALAHGLAIFTMVSAFGHISGGHFNPAVTLGVCIASWRHHGKGLQLFSLLISYIPFQLIGALGGALALAYAVPHAVWIPVKLGVPQVAAGVSLGGAIFIEALLTFFLVMTVCGAALDRNRGLPRALAPLAIGGAVTMGILAGGWLSGAAMNPARAFGPAALFGLIEGEWHPIMAYVIGPLIGGFLAGLVYPDKEEI